MRSPAEATPGFVYVADLEAAGALIDLSPDEAHYVARVCRARPGDLVTATDGRGRTASVRLVDRGPRVAGRVESVTDCPRPGRAWVLTGPPEGQRADWLVEKLAELSVERWQPIECARAAWGRHAGRLERWRRVAIAALKQSRSAHLLEIMEPVSLAEALRGLPPDASRWLARREAPSPPSARPADRAVVAVGPSPGFSDEEDRALTDEGFRPIRLAAGRLRTETAALAWAAWWGTLVATEPA